jgi:hypothetical protein
LLQDPNTEQEFLWQVHDGYAQADNFDLWLNNTVDGIIRASMFEGTPEQFKKYNYSAEEKERLLDDNNPISTPLKQIKHHLQYPHGIMMPEVEVVGSNKQNGGYAKSGIHIKPENKGKFTASAKRAGRSVQEHARAVLNNPNATPLQKKRANFARNAAKWKKLNGGLIKAQEGITGESLEDRLTPDVSKEKAYLKNTYQSNPYKQRLLNEVAESLKMPNRYRYKDPETVTDYLIDARVKNLDETKVLPSISFEEGVPSASDVFRQIKPSQGTYLGLALPQYGDIRMAKFQDKGVYFPMSRNPIIAFNPNKYGLQYNENPEGLLKLSDAAIEEQEHASHFATPFSGVNSPRMLDSGEAYEEANNITNFARNVIKQNATDDPYLGKPTEAIAAKRRIEYMLSNLPKGTLSTPFEYGQMMTDEHFNFILEKAKQGEPNSVRMMQTLMGPDAEKMLKENVNPEDLNKFKQSFKNIMDKIAINDSKEQISTAKYGKKIPGSSLPCKKCGGKHKPGVMCYGGDVSTSFKIIDEQDILHPSDSDNFATKENNNPVGFMMSKKFSKSFKI